jgi:hypothetical protein
MSVAVAELRALSADAVFDLEDRHARVQGVRGAHPRPLAPARFVAVARITGGGRVELDPPLELGVLRNPSGFDLFFGYAAPVGSDTARRLEQGTYAVRVSSGGVYQTVERADIAIPAPDTPYRFELEPSYAYPFPSGAAAAQGGAPTLLRGGLQGPDGTGIEGARVDVPALAAVPTHTTDESGQWVLVFPEGQASGNVSVRFRLPDGTTTNVAGVPILATRDSTLPQTALRGSVTTDAGAPIPAATVTVSGQPGSTRSRVDGGWFYYFRPGQPGTNVTVTATLPDGRSQSRGGVPVQPRSTVVVQSFRFG